MPVPRVIEVATAPARPGWGVRSILYPGVDLTTPRHAAALPLAYGAVAWSRARRPSP